MPSGDVADIVLSGSTNGRPIAVAATSSPGTTIHTATSTSGDRDHITLWATNIDTVDRTVTLQVGGTSTSDQIGPITLAANSGPVLVMDRWHLQGGLLLRAFASATNIVNVTGRVARYTD
jgi:hypothetical protein